MRNLLGVALLSAFAATQAGGCGDEGDPTPMDLHYPDGHPLSASTFDATVLAMEDQLDTLTNRHRVSIGLNALVSDPKIREAARAHSQNMIVQDFFDHKNPEGDHPWDRLSKVGIPWTGSGENIAAGYLTASDAFNAWLNSPGHRANIENPNWTHVGNGYWDDPLDAGVYVYQRYYTQNFVRQ